MGKKELPLTARVFDPTQEVLLKLQSCFLWQRVHGADKATRTTKARQKSDCSQVPGPPTAGAAPFWPCMAASSAEGTWLLGC